MSRHSRKARLTARPATLREISKARAILGNPYAYLDDNGQYSGIVVVDHQVMHAELQKLLGKLGQRQSDAALEKNVNDLLNWGWKYRHIIWADPPQTLIELLDPWRFLELLGYQIQAKDSLGSFMHRGKETHTAAIININAKTMQYSSNPSIPHRSMRFTLAHELGHACRHSGTAMQLHRDIALDAPEKGRNPLEQQADRFASLFCMPKNPVIRAVQQRFKSTRIELDDQTRFRLGARNMTEYEEFSRFDNERMALAKTIAKATSFDGIYFVSLAEEFGVSVKAMAIRLIELQVV